MILERLKTKELEKLCSSSEVKALYAFGSVLGKEFTDESDIDLVVDFDEKDPLKYADLYFGLKEKLEQLFNRKIDLLEERAIKNPFFRKHLDDTKVRIYGY